MLIPVPVAAIGTIVNDWQLSGIWTGATGSGNRQVQLRVDMFNAPNSAIITQRNSTVSLASPSDPVTALNLPFDAAGNLVAARSLPRGAGFGVATGYQAPRTVQRQMRFSF